MDDEPIKRPVGRPRATLPVKLLRGYQPEGMRKQPLGAELELPADEARRMVSLGIAERNDAF